MSSPEDSAAAGSRGGCRCPPGQVPLHPVGGGPCRDGGPTGSASGLDTGDRRNVGFRSAASDTESVRRLMAKFGQARNRGREISRVGVRKPIAAQLSTLKLRRRWELGTSASRSLKTAQCAKSQCICTPPLGSVPLHASCVRRISTVK